MQLTRCKIGTVKQNTAIVIVLHSIYSLFKKSAILWTKYTLRQHTSPPNLGFVCFFKMKVAQKTKKKPHSKPLRKSEFVISYSEGDLETLNPPRKRAGSPRQSPLRFPSPTEARFRPAGSRCRRRHALSAPRRSGGRDHPRPPSPEPPPRPLRRAVGGRGGRCSLWLEGHAG